MDIFLHSSLLVAIGEIGDKTQLLAILLAARYRHSFPIISGIIIATTLNHALAVSLGEYLGSLTQYHWIEWILATSFIVIGLWVLKPDSVSESDLGKDFGAFVTSFFAFFMAEMGDKTQLTTIALAVEYKAFLPVLIGTTFGMLVANLPAVFFGHALINKISMRWVRIFASTSFIGFGMMKAYQLVDI